MNALKSIFWILLCIILQGLLFGHLSVYGAVILVYVIVLLKLPILWNPSAQILVGFLVGLAVDIFCNTPGMHAFAATTLMAVRRPVLLNNFYDNKEDVKDGFLGINAMEPGRYVTYISIFVTGYSLLLYLIESFTLFNLQMLLIKIVIGSIMTIALALSIEFVGIKK